MAIIPEQNVNTSEIKAADFQAGDGLRYKYSAVNPVADTSMSSEKNDQFQAIKIGFL